MQLREESQLGPLALYVVTAALELPVILARYAAIYVVAAIALKATGHADTDAAGWAKLAVLPTLFSAAALVNPAGGSWWWQQRLGGREPSKREHIAYRTALDELEAGTAMLLPRPKHWFVTEASEPDAAVCGDTLMLSRGLLEGPHLTAVLAHQLGHLRGIDARMTAALDRLVLDGGERVWLTTVTTPPSSGPAQAPSAQASSARASVAQAPASAPQRRWLRRMTIALLRGGLGLRVTSIGWAKMWREAEYEADRFAAHIGQGEELADFLEAHVLKHDHPIPLVGLTDHTHPPTKLRIDALREQAKRQPRPDVGSAQSAPQGAAPGTLKLDTTS